MECSKAPVFLEVVFRIATMEQPKYNLEEKDGPSILKDGLFAKRDASIFTSIAPELG